MNGHDSIIKEILKLQKHRGKDLYDSHIYGDNSLTIATSLSDEDENDDHVISSSRKQLSSYTASRSQMMSTLGPEGNSNVVMKPRETIADREDEYRRRWRKRQLSPPKSDPFAPQQNNIKRKRKIGGNEDNRSYKDIMQEHLLSIEECEVHRAIEAKKKEEQEKNKELERVRRQNTKQEQEQKYKQKKEKRRKLRKLGKKSVCDWNLIGVNQGKTFGSIPLKLDSQVTFGRDSGADFVLNNPSCSTYHAKIKYLFDSKESNNVPMLVDMNSTNGTYINKKKIGPGYHRLFDGAIINFGLSDKEFLVQYRR